MDLFKTAFALFLLMDPIGNIPLFIATLKDIHPKRQKMIILRELLIALVVMLFFNFLGDGLLKALDVSNYSVLISGGIILFIISLKMIFPSKNGHDLDLTSDREPLIVPLAIPLIAGPAVLAAIILYSYEEKDLTTCSAIALAWGVSTLILLMSPFLQKILGKRGITAMEKLMGLLLTMVSIEMFMTGITEYAKS